MSPDEPYQADAGHEPGITIQQTKVTQAFTLINLMVGELIFIDQTIAPPADLVAYDNFDANRFVKLRKNLMLLLQEEKHITLGIDDSIGFYLLIDLVCKCMVNESNEVLRELAFQNLDLNAEEYAKVRLSFLKYADALIEKINQKLCKDERFISTLEKLSA